MRACVFLHAHPDDEALLTGGTMARLAAEGERVVLVVATAGGHGLTGLEGAGRGAPLEQVRLRELQASAAALGCARVVELGYADSGGLGATPGPGSFATADPTDAAERVAAVLREEDAALLTVYDPVGGYGHPDHVQVHRVGTDAARLAGTPRVLEATVDRDLLLRGARLVSHLPGVAFDVAALAGSYASRSEITHRVDVCAFARAKRRALAAHVSQRTGGAGTRTVEVLLRLPFPVFRRVLGTEWYVDRGAAPGRRSTHPLDRG
jgi:LmbE family N-acetylglucosaminyl deacetylase